MKKKLTSIASGLSAISLLAFALVACSDDSSSVSSEPRCEALDPECGFTEEELCDRGYVQYCKNAISSSSATVESSSETVTSSETVSSSSVVEPIGTGIDETCLDMSNMCPPCEDEDCPTPFFPCNSCQNLFAREHFECNTGELYVCGNTGTWSPTGLTEENLLEMATDVKAEPPTGAAVTPRVVKVVNADGSVTFRDDGANIYNDFVVGGVRGILTGDTLYVKILYPGSPYNGSFQQGIITFTLSKDFANVKYYRYIEDVYKKKTIFEEK